LRDLIRQGAFDQLALALERGGDGNIPMSAAIAELSRTGRVDPRNVDLARTEPAATVGRLETRVMIGTAEHPDGRPTMVPLP